MRFARLLALSALVVVPPLGCSDPVPPTPKAAWSVTFLDAGPQCAHTGHNRLLGTVSSTTKQALLADGQSGAKVSCTVTKSGTNFSVEGRAQQGGNSLDIQVTIPPNATRDSPAKGQVAFASDVTVDTFFSRDTPCDFFFEPGGQAVAEGRAWLTIVCPKIDAGVPEDFCSLGDSFAIFENCAGAAEEED